MIGGIADTTKSVRRVVRIPKGVNRGKGEEAIFENLMAKNLQNF